MKVESTSLMAFFAHEVSQRPKATNLGISARIKQAVWRVFVSFADWFLSWSENYRALKERYFSIEKPLETSRWSTSFKVGLIAASILVVGVGLYYFNQQSSTVNNALEDFNNERSLDSVCREVVHNFSKLDSNGTKIWLRDYLAPSWVPFVHQEYGRDTLCSVDLVSNNCSALVGQPTVEQRHSGLWPFVFARNYEAIPAPPGLSFSFFKSHIFCTS